MDFFDFHHHHLNKRNGIYNLGPGETPPDYYFSAGIHPNLSSTGVRGNFEWLKEVSKHKFCVAIGECGLDGLIQTDDRIQEDVFERQIYLANEIQKPLIIHCVRRFSRLIHFQKIAQVPLIVHGFNKRKTIGEELQKHEFHLSFGKSLLHNLNLQEFVKGFPLDKLLLESDGSDCSLELLYRKVADLKMTNLNEVRTSIEQNLRTLNISPLI